MLCFWEFLCYDLNRWIWIRFGFKFPEIVFFDNDDGEWEEEKDDDGGSAATILVLSELCFAFVQ